MTGAAVTLLALVSALLVAIVAIWRANRRETLSRASMLDGCGGVLEGAAASVSPSGHGVLRGRFHHRRASLTPIAEALGFRKLPQLWLSAVLGDVDEDRPSIEIVRRPTSGGLFDGGSALPMSAPAPAGWPPDTSVRVSQDASALLRTLDPVLACALTDPKLKAVSIGPRGVRVVRQAAQGSRGAYLLFREQRFQSTRISPDDARAALTLAAALIDAMVDHDRIETRNAA
jgi:hypothetical protein